MKQVYINLNGELLPADKPSMMHNNRASYYADALFETIHANGTEPQFIDEHYDRLKHGLKTLEITTKLNRSSLKQEIVKLLNKNRHYNGTRVRLTVFRQNGGLYTPLNNQSNFIIESSPLKDDYYVLNTKGLFIDFYEELHKPINKLSNLKSTNAQIYTQAGLYKTKNKLDECILLNTNHSICESISSNLFFVMGNKLLTPSLSCGCVDGVMRRKIIEIADFFKYETIEHDSIEKDVFEYCDEAFLSNAIRGVQWIIGFGKRRFYNQVSRELTDALNKIAFNS